MHNFGNCPKLSNKNTDTFVFMQGRKIPLRNVDNLLFTDMSAADYY